MEKAMGRSVVSVALLVTLFLSIHLVYDATLTHDDRDQDRTIHQSAGALDADNKPVESDATTARRTPEILVEDMPFEPMLRPDCEVISSVQKFLCVDVNEEPFHFAATNRSVAVTRRTLEHIFQCDASQLIRTSGQSTKDCFHWQSNSGDPAYLIPFLYQGFYYLPTTRISVTRKVCVNTDYSSIQPPTDPQSLTTYEIQYHSPNRPWPEFYNDLRYCDFVAVENGDSNLQTAASSMGIPTVPIQNVANLSLYPKQPPAWSLTYLNYTHANTILKTFPVHLFETRRVQRLDLEATHHESPPTNKTLVILLGSLRGGEITWQTMYRHLLDLNQADLALMIGKTTERSNSSLYERATYIWEFQEYEDWGEPIDVIFGTAWRNTVLPHTSMVRGLFGGVEGRFSSTAITFMARYWLRQALMKEGILQKYERFVVSRSDQWYSCAHDLSLLDPKYIWLPSGEDYAGLTDRHFVCHRSHIIKSLDMYPHFLEHPDKYLARNQTLKDNAEQMMRRRWMEQGLYWHVRRFPRVMYTVALPTDPSSRWKKISYRDFRTSSGVVTKYFLEFKVSECVCTGEKIFVKPQKRADPIQQQYYDCVNNTAAQLDEK